MRGRGQSPLFPANSKTSKTSKTETQPELLDEAPPSPAKAKTSKIENPAGEL